MARETGPRIVRVEKLGSPLVDPRAVDKLLVDRALLAMYAEPIPPLTREQQEALDEGDAQALRPLAKHLVARRIDRLNLGLELASEHSYGLKVQSEDLSALEKLIHGDRLNVRVDGELRALPDASLIALVEQLGLVATTTGGVRALAEGPGAP